MMKVFKAILITLAVSLLVGCSKSDFNPYQHLSRIMTITKQEQFAADKEYLLSHASADIQEELIARLDATIYDPVYTIKETNCFCEDNGDTIKLLAEYYCTSIQGSYYLITTFTYTKDILTDMHIYRSDIY